MKKLLLIGLLVFNCCVSAISQVVTTNPAVPSPTQPVTITVNVEGTSLDNYAWNNSTAPVWAWFWISQGCSSNCDAPTNINPATSPGQDAAKATRISVNPDIYQITITPTAFFNKPASELKQIGIKLKTRDWADNKQTDNNRFIVLSEGFALNVSQPLEASKFVNSGESIQVTANTNQPSAITISVDGATVASSAGNVTIFNYLLTANETSGTHEVLVSANNGTEAKTYQFTYTIRTTTINQARPAGIKDGINYHTDQTKVTLSLWAPGKSSVYVIGDFSDWQIDSEFQMKKDGEHFWLEVDGLTPGQEYAFRYLVDESVFIADPYADKILDPDDQYISESTYPDLMDFPDEALSSQSYFNRLSVLQTGQQSYSWNVENFDKPAKENLVIYELLVRDFFENGERTYQNLIDTIGYFKKLGINAIELMPIMEFNGNESWGYNPTFMFAPDKAYGTKNKLKEFIDVCHQNGIAVILDIALNHQDTPNSYALMDFDFSSFKPKATNKWFNPDAKHPYNVFFDLNHESVYTKTYIDTINHYWLNEYKVDGFRFDLSKGFTQNTKCGGSTSNESCFATRDDSRIAILKRMADKIWSHTDDAIIILEHFADNSEEKELAEYRLNEGKGMMLWTNVTHAYAQNSMGYGSNSDFSWINTDLRNWSARHAVGYMESHDEERMMYRNLQNGQNVSGYNIKTTPIALKRVMAASAFFYTIPGPKMLWQFGELGYDFPINYCPDGTINNGCRTYDKPVKWEYRDQPERYALYEHISDLLRLRNTYDVFTDGTPTIAGGTNLKKQMILRNNPYTAAPANESEMNAVVVVNFDVTNQNMAVEFPHTGTWYEYYSNGSELSVELATAAVQLKPGEYKIFTDVRIENPNIITGGEQERDATVSLYPNPAGETLNIASDIPVRALTLITIQGIRVNPERISEASWDISQVAPGLYVADVETQSGRIKVKVIKTND